MRYGQQTAKKTCHNLAMILAQTEKIDFQLSTVNEPKYIPRQKMVDRYKPVGYQGESCDDEDDANIHIPKNPPMQCLNV